MTDFVRQSAMLMTIVWLMHSHYLAAYTPADDTRAPVKVFTFEIHQEIDSRALRKVKLALKAAKEQQADLVVLDLNSYGGQVSDSDEIRTAILQFEKPVYAFVNTNGASSATLIVLSCDSIYMAPGASFGAATVTTSDGYIAGAKYQSYIRSIVRSTAQATHRNSLIAEAMVDPDMEIEGVTKAGEVLSFSTAEAIDNGFCEAEVMSITELLSYAGFEEPEIIYFELNIWERIGSFFLHPMLVSVLIVVGIGAAITAISAMGFLMPMLMVYVVLIYYWATGVL